MHRTPVTSLHIREIGYDPQTSILEVEFISGDVYQYFDVPEYIHGQFMNAPSKGKFLYEYIRYNYRYQKIR